ncbi:MAG: DUF4249 domain-containing protein [Saprospiraceae bacterium]|nr:DUF4249 domain-containing protein [Saprospiraceae bacterium]
MKNIKLGFIAIAIITLFASCEDMFRGSILEVELPPHESQLAPYAFFKDTDSVLTVMVGKSVGILDTINPDVVYGATVELYRNGSLAHTFTFVDSVKGYQVDLGQPFNPTVGDEYELKVSAPGFTPTSAIQIIPSTVLIDTLEYDAQGSVNQFGDPLDVYKLTFTDPAGISNYYEITGYVVVKYRNFFDTTIIQEYSYSVDFESRDPNFENGTLSDVNFDGQRYTLRLETYPNFWGGDVTGTLYFRSTTPEYATFISSLNNYWRAKDNPFSEPVLLYSNMSGGLGAFGIFVTDTKAL